MAVTQLRGINPTRGRHGNSATPVTIHDSKAIIYLHKNKHRNVAKLAAETAIWETRFHEVGKACTESLGL
jgi:hypothetical protein